MSVLYNLLPFLPDHAVAFPEKFLMTIALDAQLLA